MISCYIIDDEFHAIEVLTKMIHDTLELTLLGSSTNPIEALHDINTKNPPDLIFLDVDMSPLSGIQFSRLVTSGSLIVFTTGFLEYAHAAFDHDAVDFLLKPISYERFLHCVNKVKVYIKKTEKPILKFDNQDHFFIKTQKKGTYLKIIISDILYVEGALNYVIIYLKGARHLSYVTMQEIEDVLANSSFSRIHRSYIINNHKVQSVENGHVVLDDKTKITIGVTYRDEFLKQLNELIVQTKRP